MQLVSRPDNLPARATVGRIPDPLEEAELGLGILSYAMPPREQTGQVVRGYADVK